MAKRGERRRGIARCSLALEELRIERNGITAIFHGMFEMTAPYSNFRRTRSMFAIASLLIALTTACSEPRPAPRFHALVFSRTAGFRHDAIPAALAAIRQLAQDNNFTADPTEDPSVFNDANLARYQVVIFALTTGDVLDDTQQGALERFIRSGRGFVGFHSASDTEYDWPWYGGLVGAWFRTHGPIEQGTVIVSAAEHPITSALPAHWVRTDEWYQFRSAPPAAARILATLDGPAPHAIIWCQSYDGGRSFYTAAGHTSASYAEPLFLTHLLRGIEYAAGVLPAGCVS
jgi:cytochrome c